MDDDECEFNDRTEEITVNNATPGEVKQAIKRLQNGKAPVINSITLTINIELLNADKDFSAMKVHQLLLKI